MNTHWSVNSAPNGCRNNVIISWRSIYWFIIYRCRQSCYNSYYLCSIHPSIHPVVTWLVDKISHNFNTFFHTCSCFGFSRVEGYQRITFQGCFMMIAFFNSRKKYHREGWVRVNCEAEREFIILSAFHQTSPLYSSPVWCVPESWNVQDFSSIWHQFFDWLIGKKS